MQGSYAAVPAELMEWVFGGGKKLPGLVTRREAEVAFFVAA
ncbi:MAG: Phage lysozyme [Edaphobacter sp.]|nr:Phage lysozyme [Edaphobacter sp.]